MRLVQIHGVGKLSVDDVPAPTPGPKDIVLKIAACGICGSDLSYARYGVLRPESQPFPLGHEAAGTVISVGPEVERITPGMRVLINPAAEPGNVIGNGGSEGAFADLLLMRNARLGIQVLPLPDGMTFSRAALAEPLAVGMHGVNRAQVTKDSKVVVFGAGPIGLAAVFWLKRRGVTSVVSVDFSEDRLRHAERLGSDATINPQRENLRDRLLALHGEGIPVLGETTVGTDVFLDMAGGKTVIPDIIALAQYHARLVISAVYPKPVELDLLKALMKELHITTAGAYPTELHDTLAELEHIGEADLAPYVSHSFRFEDFFEAFETAKSPSSAKVMVEFD